MKFFEIRYGAGVGQDRMNVAPHREALWAKAFGVESLEGLFDQTIRGDAIPKVDAAILMFNHDPEPLRPFLDPQDRSGLYGNRKLLEQMRETLEIFEDATISGLVES